MQAEDMLWIQGPLDNRSLCKKAAYATRSAVAHPPQLLRGVTGMLSALLKRSRANDTGACCSTPACGKKP
jgi:hypothetical protein